MADNKETTIAQSLNIGQMVEAKVIPAVPVSETTSVTQSLRTVATSLTTGQVSIRYVPRVPQASGNPETTS